jgi:hypothetical protein
MAILLVILAPLVFVLFAIYTVLQLAALLLRLFFAAKVARLRALGVRAAAEAIMRKLPIVQIDDLRKTYLKTR